MKHRRRIGDENHYNYAPQLKYSSYAKKDTNVGENERIVSAVIGGILTIWGLGRLGIGGFVRTVVGGYLLYRGISGYCAFNEVLGRKADAHSNSGSQSDLNNISENQNTETAYQG